MEIRTMMMYGLTVSLAAAFLFYASLEDVKKREVQNKVWAISVPICLLLSTVGIYFGYIDLLSLVASMGVALVLGVSLNLVGFYGGADAKALLLIAAATPSYLMADFLLARLLPLPILLIFFCTTLLSALVPLTMLILNVIDRLRGKRLLQDIDVGSLGHRLILYVTARRVKLETLKASLKYFPAEIVVREGEVLKRKPTYFIHAEANIDELVEQLETHQELFKDGVLASPTIPLIVFLTAGFIVSNILILWGIALQIA